MRSTNSAHLERWLGTDGVEQVSRSVRGFYGPPIALAGVPGNVYICGDGDFIGECRAGYEMSAQDRLADILRRAKRAARVVSREQRHRLNSGFAGLSEVVTEFFNGKGQTIPFARTSPVVGTGAPISLWASGATGATPDLGTAAASAAPSGDVLTSATTGSLTFNNAVSGETLHFIEGVMACGTSQHCLMLYDRLFQVGKTMSSTSTESVTGTPTRYQSTTATNPDYIGGNFIFPEVSSGLSATAHNWDAVYTNQAGTGSKSAQTVTGNSSGALYRIDMSTYQWFMPLATNDVGVKSLNSMTCSASVTGGVNFVLGHPIAILPTINSGFVSKIDGMVTAFNLTRVFDDACLAFLDICPGSSSQTYVNGYVRLASS